jgi:hypothetical protein
VRASNNSQSAHSEEEEEEEEERTMATHTLKNLLEGHHATLT